MVDPEIREVGIHENIGAIDDVAERLIKMKSFSMSNNTKIILQIS